MKHIIILLLKILDQERGDSTQYVVAHYLMTNLYEIKDMSVQSIAEACHVSSASISRFCKNIGLEDFHELKYLAKQENHEKSYKFNFEKQTDNYIQDYVDSVKEKMDLLYSINQDILNQIVQDIHHYKNIILMGHMQSANIAYSLQHDLAPYYKFIYCTQDIAEQKYILNHSDPETLIIIFSASGSFFDRVLPRGETIKKEIRPKIYMITSKKTVKRDDVYEVVHLDQQYSYASSAPLMTVYANLIALGCMKIAEKGQ